MKPDFNLMTFIVENTLSFAFTTLVLGVIVDLVRRIVDYLLKRRYRDWTLWVVPSDVNRERYDTRLSVEEIQRFEESDFERRKFIQSVVSSEGGRLKEGKINTDDPDGWLYICDKNKTYNFDMKKFLSSKESKDSKE